MQMFSQTPEKQKTLSEAQLTSIFVFTLESWIILSASTQPTDPVLLQLHLAERHLLQRANMSVYVSEVKKTRRGPWFCRVNERLQSHYTSYHEPLKTRDGGEKYMLFISQHKQRKRDQSVTW